MGGERAPPIGTPAPGPMVGGPEHGLVDVDEDPTFLQGMDVVLGCNLPDKSELVSIVER